MANISRLVGGRRERQRPPSAATLGASVEFSLRPDCPFRWPTPAPSQLPTIVWTHRLLAATMATETAAAEAAALAEQRCSARPDDGAGASGRRECLRSSSFLDARSSISRTGSRLLFQRHYLYISTSVLYETGRFAYG